MKNSQQGFGAIMAIVVLVTLATLAAAVTRFGSVAQLTSAQSVLSARASQAARAGTEWGLYQAFKGTWVACSGASQTLDLTSSTGLRVTVSCDSRTFNEGESAAGTPRIVRIYTIDAVACSSNATCPDDSAAASLTYIERRRQVHATDQ